MNNLEYLYSHLPSRFRREDKDLFLKRFLQFFGQTLDGYDSEFEQFFEQIKPATARMDFVVFWLQELFDWNWFPKWFLDADKRRIYANMARHLARRGIARGIKEWLTDFYIESVVHKSPIFYGEHCYGEPLIFVNEPLVLVIGIGKVAPPNYRADICIYSEIFYGESFYAEAEALYRRNEVENLLRHVQPHAQEFIIYPILETVDLNAPLPPDTTPPTVTLIDLNNPTPLPGYYSGTITFAVAATDDRNIHHIDVYIAGALFNTIQGPTGTINWDTTQSSAIGSTETIEVKAKAFDFAGNQSAFLVKNVQVNNPLITRWENLGSSYNLLPDKSAEFVGGAQQRLYTTPRLQNSGDYVRFIVPNHINTYTELRATDVVTGDFLYVIRAGYARNDDGSEDHYSASYSFDSGDTIEFQRLSGNAFRYLKNGTNLLDFSTTLVNAVQISFEWLYAVNGDVIQEPQSNLN